MNIRSFSLFFLAVAILCYRPANSITDKQKENGELTFNKYASALSEFSNGKDKDASELGALMRDINSAVDSDYFDYDSHFYDLNLFKNREDITGDEDMETWRTYMDEIKNEFNNEIEMSFEDIRLLDCKEEENMVIQFTKKITYKSTTKEIAEVAIISLPSDENNSPGYKIKFIYSARAYVSQSDACKNQIIVSKEDVELVEKTKEANNYFFEQNDYLNAKSLYDYILKKDPENKYIKKQIEICITKIAQNDYLQKAENYFQIEEFSKAGFWYEKLINEFPALPDANVVRAKIEDCKVKDINKRYTDAINKANQALSLKDYINARYNFESALSIKHGDSYALSQLENAKILDDNYASRQIQIAISYYDKGKYGEYFKILRKYEGYGNKTRLNTRQYYYMVMFLDLQKNDFLKESGLSRKECRQYCRIYSKKLQDALYNEWRFQWKDDAERLLYNIKKRNQL